MASYELKNSGVQMTDALSREADEFVQAYNDKYEEIYGNPPEVSPMVTSGYRSPEMQASAMMSFIENNSEDFVRRTYKSDHAQDVLDVLYTKEGGRDAAIAEATEMLTTSPVSSHQLGQKVDFRYATLDKDVMDALKLEQESLNIKIYEEPNYAWDVKFLDIAEKPVSVPDLKPDVDIQTAKEDIEANVDPLVLVLAFVSEAIGANTEKFLGEWGVEEKSIEALKNLKLEDGEEFGLPSTLNNKSSEPQIS